jgi:H+/Cl- antiporter ClcA
MGYESCFPNFPTPGQISWICFSIYLMLAVYLGLFGMAVHNTSRYLIKQRKYKIYLFTCFYALVFTLIVSRVAYYVYQWMYFHDVTNC